jgi:hypothetical protein
VEGSIHVVRISAQGKGDFACIGIHGEGLMLGERKRGESQRKRENQRLCDGLHVLSPFGDGELKGYGSVV